jgi:hypothetical protein
MDGFAQDSILNSVLHLMAKLVHKFEFKFRPITESKMSVVHISERSKMSLKKDTYATMSQG